MAALSKSENTQLNHPVNAFVERSKISNNFPLPSHVSFIELDLLAVSEKGVKFSIMVYSPQIFYAHKFLRRYCDF